MIVPSRNPRLETILPQTKPTPALVQRIYQKAVSDEAGVIQRWSAAAEDKKQAVSQLGFPSSSEGWLQERANPLSDAQIKSVAADHRKTIKKHLPSLATYRPSELVIASLQAAWEPYAELLLRALAYLDYAAAEILIAAVLSGDQNMLADYLNGDVYTNCAIRMGLAPAGSTKGSIGTLRDVMKVWLLSTLYGASPKSLREKLAGSTLEQAEEFVRQNRESYSRYWAWSNRRTDIFLYETGVEATAFGWQHHLDASERFDDYLFWGARNRSRNFPMQATCAEILRWACVLASDDDITIHAPLHDAVLIGAPDAEIEDAVVRMRRHMTAASRLVLGVDMKVPMPSIIRYPERMRDPRGAKTWDEMMKRLENLDRKTA